MKLSYFHVAEDVPDGRIPDAAVVIDVLRATTTIAWALNNGAESIQTFIDINELKLESSKWPTSLRLLVGERGGKTLEGFDLGNSPLGVQPELVKGKRLFMSTTNGTRALNRFREAKSLVTLALPNRKAVAEKLLIDQPEDLCILGSGWEGTYSLEDSLAAGGLAAFLLERQSDSITVINDELNAALALWHSWKENIEGCLRIASHGQRLVRIGNHDDDFACCAEVDKLSVVPTQTEAGILRAI
tara:strand:+ start:3481 stop:4212 length:732 start_codon:yes stop_codon:yes gene_type:complete